VGKDEDCKVFFGTFFFNTFDKVWIRECEVSCSLYCCEKNWEKVGRKVGKIISEFGAFESKFALQKKRV
jgi:hypothetical protein